MDIPDLTHQNLTQSAEEVNENAQVLFNASQLSPERIAIESHEPPVAFANDYDSDSESSDELNNIIGTPRKEDTKYKPSNRVKYLTTGKNPYLKPIGNHYMTWYDIEKYWKKKKRKNEITDSCNKACTYKL